MQFFKENIYEDGWMTLQFSEKQETCKFNIKHMQFFKANIYVRKQLFNPLRIENVFNKRLTCKKIFENFRVRNYFSCAHLDKKPSKSLRSF